MHLKETGEIRRLKLQSMIHQFQLQLLLQRIHQLQLKLQLQLLLQQTHQLQLIPQLQLIHQQIHQLQFRVTNFQLPKKLQTKVIQSPSHLPQKMFQQEHKLDIMPRTHKKQRILMKLDSLKFLQMELHN